MTANREALTDRNHRIAKLAAARVVERVDRYREQLGIRPWESKELSPDDALRTFAEIADDPIAWGELVQAERQLFHLTEDRIPKRLYQEAAAMWEKLQRKGVPPTVEEEDARTA